MSFSESNCVVTLGSDGKKQFSIPIEQGKKAYLIIDPRADPASYITGKSEVVDGAGEGNVVYVLLMSSSSSGPEARMTNETSMNCMGVFSALGALEAGPESAFYIRMDDYFVHGDKILAALVESGKQIYPAEDVENMFSVSKSFENNIYSNRAFCHWAMGGGIEEDDIREVHFNDEGNSGISKHFKAGTQTALPALDGSVISGNGPILSPGPILPSEIHTTFMAFNTATTEMLIAALPGATINQVNAASASENMGELTFLKRMPTSFKSKLMASAANNAACQCSKKIVVSACNPPEDPEDRPECEQCMDPIAADTYANCEKCGICLCSDCYVDLPENEIETAMVTMVGPVEEDGNVISKEYVLFIDAETDCDFQGANRVNDTEMSVCRFASKLREIDPAKNICVVVLADSYDSLRNNKRMMMFVPPVTENCDNVIFALKSEMNFCKDLFCGAKYPTETVTLLMSRNMVPFPRLHFFTFGTNMGQELADGSIICSAFTLADTTKGSGIPAEKFVAGYPNQVTKKLKPIINIPKPDGTASLDHVLSGVEGTNVTVINNLQMIQDLCYAWTAWAKDAAEDIEEEALGALYSEHIGFKFEDAMVVTETLSNTKDLISEHEQYMKINQGEDSVDEDED